MFKFGEGALGDEIKDTEISFSEVPMFNTDISPEEAMSFWNKQFESVPEISMKDILNRSEDEFSFDYDLSNMKELMDKFDIVNGQIYLRMNGWILLNRLCLK